MPPGCRSAMWKGSGADGLGSGRGFPGPPTGPGLRVMSGCWWRGGSGGWGGGGDESPGLQEGLMGRWGLEEGRLGMGVGSLEVLWNVGGGLERGRRCC